MTVSSADIVNRALMAVGGYNNDGPVTGSPPNFDGSTQGLAAGTVYNDVVQAIGRKFGWDFSRNLATLVLSGGTAPFGYAYEYIYPTNGIQLRQLVPPTVSAAAKLDPRPQRWTVGNAFGGSAQATGSVTFTTNAANNDTLVLNGTTFTFVNDNSGWPSQSSSYKINIAGNAGGTAFFLWQALTAGATYLANVTLNVAIYTNATSNVVGIAYKVPGTGGNAYTLAKVSTHLTLSGATLSGGASAQQKVIWTDLASAVGVITNQPPESTWDALFTESVVRLLGSYLDLALAGKPEAAAALIESAAMFEGSGEERTDT